MTRPEDIIGQSVARLNEATATAREVLTELHGTAKDMKALIKEGRQLLADLSYTAAHIAEAEVNEEVKKHIKAAVEGLGKATQAEMEKSVAKVNAEFDKLAKILLGVGQRDKPSLEELVNRIAKS